MNEQMYNLFSVVKRIKCWYIAQHRSFDIIMLSKKKLDKKTTYIMPFV